MKKIFLTLLIVSLVGVATAQQRNDKKRGEAVAIGVRVGGNLASYYYTDNATLNGLGYDSIMQRVKPMLGLSVEIPLFGGVVYVAPEVSFTGRGDSRLFHSLACDTTMRYQATVNYLEARLPISVAIPVASWFKPYVFAAPSFGLALPSLGQSRLLASEFRQYSFDSPQTISDTVAVDAGNMSLYDLGLTAGVGLRFNINFGSFMMVVKLEGGYHMGFLNTYSEKELYDQATAVNLNPNTGHQYNIKGERRNRGIEGAITIAIPLDFHSSDDCFYWSDVYKRRNNNRGYFGF